MSSLSDVKLINNSNYSYTRAIPIKGLMSKKPLEVRDRLVKGGIVVYDDGVGVAMSHREIIVTRYLLEVIRSIDVELPIPSTFSIVNYYNDGIYTSSSFNKFWSDLLKYMVNEYIREHGRNKYLKGVFKSMFLVLDDLYNEIVCAYPEYITGADIRDYLEIQYDPDLMAAIDKAHIAKDEASVDNSHDVLHGVLMNPKYRHNPIAMSYVAGAINPNQIKQMLACRGFLIEINSQIFKIPVTSSFVLGMRNLYELTVESRAGAMALYTSTIAVEKSEYFAREWQLVTAIVNELTDGDCGSTDYITWKVRSASEANGKSDLVNLVGKWYLDEDTNKLKIIEPTDTHLIGKTIKLRSVHKCKNKDKTTVCETCFGDMAYGVFEHTNLGNISSSSTSGKMTQGMLSVKHLTKSAKGTAVKIDEVVKTFFTIKGGNKFHFRSNISLDKRSRYVLLVDQSEAPGIKDLNSSVDPMKINPARGISKIKTFYLEVTSGDGTVDIFEIKVKNGSQYGVFTKEFLAYVIEHSYSLDKYDRVAIDLTNWDIKDPLIYTPEMEFNFLELSREVKSMFKKIDEPEDIEAMTQKVFDTINSKLNINLALIEAIVYAFSVKEPGKNAELDRFNEEPEKGKVVKIEECIVNRSLGAAYGWETVTNVILNPNVYYGRNAIDHPMDVYVKPKETVDAWKKKNR